MSKSLRTTRTSSGCFQPHHDLSYGIEEEFFLVDPNTRNLAVDVPAAFMRNCRVELGERVGEEMLRPQIEIATPVLHSAGDARESLVHLRTKLAEVSSRFGLSLVAAGTHPFCTWENQKHTDKARYARLMDDFQIVGRRNVFCGLHVHVGIPQGFDRVDVMNRLMPWVPMLLALSTSSPFWNGRRTGLLSYRQAAYDERPRSGIPDSFANEAEYDAFVRLLASCGALDDGSSLWWAVRPSARFPTLELRVADACSHVDDSLAIAAVFRCLVRAHLRQPLLGAGRSSISRRVIEENRWRAKRYGTGAEFIDEASGTADGFVSVLEEMLSLISPDVEAMGCRAEVEHVRTIVRRGTSAHSQLGIYRTARNRCGTREEALSKVVDWLASATIDVQTAAPKPRVATHVAGDVAMA
jgi:glutamate---cysteine ligase / carboxylate-amine ligase